MISWAKGLKEIFHLWAGKEGREMKYTDGYNHNKPKRSLIPKPWAKWSFGFKTVLFLSICSILLATIQFIKLLYKPETSGIQ